jgi:hypothetical protein
VEWIVGTLVVLGFIAIVARFVPRDHAGGTRLPGIVNDSIGMWALRRLTGRPLRDHTDDAHAMGINGSRPILPSRYLVSPSRLRDLGIRPAGLAPGRSSTRRSALATPHGDSTVERRQQAPASGSLGAQRRLVAVAAALVVGIVLLAAVFAPRGRSGDGLAQTGRPVVTATPTPIPTTPTP